LFIAAAAKSAQTLQVLGVGNSTGLLFWYPTMDGFLSGKSYGKSCGWLLMENPIELDEFHVFIPQNIQSF